MNRQRENRFLQKTRQTQLIAHESTSKLSTYAHQYSKKISMLLVAMLFPPAISASDWIVLQGTEPSGTSSRADIFGVLQTSVQYTQGSPIPAGPWAGARSQANMIAPDYSSRAGFRLDRVQLGVHGANFPIDDEVNYVLLAELGSDGAINSSNAFRLLDASVTLNHIPGARLRVGQFKYPGAEEGLQSVVLNDFVHFSNVTDQLLLERFFNHDGSNTVVTRDVNIPNGPAGAFRDIGAQVFDSFKMGSMEYTYAGMLGNGNGLMRTDNNGAKDYYAYLAAEFILNGEGARRDGWKAFTWLQRGQRNLRAEATGIDEAVNRTRVGAGTTLRISRLHFSYEYVLASGMIPNSTDDGVVAGSVANGGVIASYNVLPHEKASGWYVDFGYQLLPMLELDMRYDVLERATVNATDQRDFSSFTLGAQLFLNRKTRAVLNYEWRSQEAPSADATVQSIANALDNRISFQVTVAY